MKKTMFYALVALMMVAFASCGSKDTKQFLHQKEIVDGMEAVINEAETCDDLVMVAFGFLALSFDDNEYAENEKMTQKEKEKIEQLAETLTKKLEEKAEMMNCDDQEDLGEGLEVFDEFMEDALFEE